MANGLISVGLALPTTGSGFADVYTSPAGKTSVAYRATINYTGTPTTATVTLNIVLGGTTFLLTSMEVGKKVPYFLSLGEVLAAGDKIEAVCTDSGATLILSLSVEDAGV